MIGVSSRQENIASNAKLFRNQIELACFGLNSISILVVGETSELTDGRGEMEFSRKTIMVNDAEEPDVREGAELLDAVATLTDLPPAWIHGEMQQLLEATGKTSSTVTLTDLREMLLIYLESVDKEFNDKST